MNSHSPSDLLPVGRPTRILWSRRRVPLSYADHVTGRIAYQPPPQAIDVESGLEARVAQKLVQLPQFVGLFSQPFTLDVVVDGRRSRYTPDFLLVLSCMHPGLARQGIERWTVIEVKPDTRYQRSRAQVDARLRQVQLAVGLAAVCLTERFLGDSV